MQGPSLPLGPLQTLSPHLPLMFPGLTPLQSPEVRGHGPGSSHGACGRALSPQRTLIRVWPQQGVRCILHLPPRFYNLIRAGSQRWATPARTPTAAGRTVTTKRELKSKAANDDNDVIRAITYQAPARGPKKYFTDVANIPNDPKGFVGAVSTPGSSGSERVRN